MAFYGLDILSYESDQHPEFYTGIGDAGIF